MTTFAKVTIAAALSMAVVAPAAAQQRTGLIGPPIFIAQPGVVTANAISSEGESASGFNIRFTTLIPTATPYFNFVAGFQWQPNGLAGNKFNVPAIYYGAVIPVALVGSITSGWISLSIDPLGVFGVFGTSDERPYTHEFVLEGAFTANIGQKFIPSTSPWSGLGVYLLLDQQITHLPEDASGDRDYWNPTMLYGLTLPIAPWGR